MQNRLVPALLLLLGACGSGEPRSSCGIAALAGPTMLLSEFSTPNQALGVPPEQLPERLVARFVAGPAFPAVVGRTDSTWAIGVEGAPPPKVTPGFGVLILDPAGSAQGVLVYEGDPVARAPVIGQVTIGGSTSVPLLGIQVPVAKYEDPRCPVFPDSVLR
jgi:hypothetical protein